MHLTIMSYISYFSVFSMYSLLFCMKRFCCCIKSKTFDQACLVCVNFKIRVFQWSAVQRCALGKGWVKDSCHNLLLAAAAIMDTIAGPLSYHTTEEGQLYS